MLRCIEVSAIPLCSCWFLFWWLFITARRLGWPVQSRGEGEKEGSGATAVVFISAIALVAVVLGVFVGCFGPVLLPVSSFVFDVYGRSLAFALQACSYKCFFLLPTCIRAFPRLCVWMLAPPPPCRCCGWLAWLLAPFLSCSQDPSIM